MRELAIALLLFVGCVGVLPAQDGSSSSTALSYTAKPDPPVDYSRERILKMFHDIDIGANPHGQSPFDGVVLIETRTFRLRFMPILGSLLTLAAGNPAARFTPGGTLSVNPFALTHTSFAYTSASYRDPFSERQFRRFLRKNERAAKKARQTN
jgi:hypothetical protein